MSTRQASDFVMPLGQYMGRTIDDIASTDEGLKYLDWAVGQPWCKYGLAEALKVYLGQDCIVRELDRIS